MIIVFGIFVVVGILFIQFLGGRIGVCSDPRVFRRPDFSEYTGESRWIERRLTLWIEVSHTLRHEFDSLNIQTALLYV